MSVFIPLAHKLLRGLIQKLILILIQIENVKSEIYSIGRSCARGISRG